MAYLYRKNCEIREGTDVPEGMRRIAFQVEYNGSHFYGFQRQKTTQKTVQYELEKAISKVANEPVTVVCAGRTDTGVHATSQVVHFDTLAERSDTGWLRGVNSSMPDTLRILDVQEVPFTFHARFSATERTYHYFIYNSHVKSSLLKNMVTWVRKSGEASPSLNTQTMRDASKNLLGKHNFTSFRSSRCQAKTATRSLSFIDVSHVGSLILIEVTANAFLHHMVRNIVGALLAVGKGREPVDLIEKLVLAEDRTLAPETADPHGLYFVDVSYPQHFNLRFSARKPIFV